MQGPCSTSHGKHLGGTSFRCFDVRRITSSFPSPRVEKLTEVIADIRQPPTPDVFALPSESQIANFSYLELLEDPDTLLRCLAITTELVKQLQAKKLSPALQTLVDTLVGLLV